MIHIDSNGGSVGRFRWINTDTRRTASSWVFWGDWWWDRTGEALTQQMAAWLGQA